MVKKQKKIGLNHISDVGSYYNYVEYLELSV